MPIFESMCVTLECPQYGKVEEHYYPTSDAQDPICECGAQKRRVISRVHAIWSKPLSEYGDRSKETFWKDLKRGGHWVARKRSGGGTEQNPKWEFIRTRQDQISYCKEEGLTDPTELNPNLQVTSDGKSWQSTMGMPGVWH